MKTKTAAQSEHVAAMDGGARWCYYIPMDANYDGKGFVPSLVVENVPGHVPMTGDPKKMQTPWYWGATQEDAERVCQSANRKRGVTDEAAVEIVASTMRGINRGARAGR